MKKLILTIILLTFVIYTTYSQKPAISMTTSLAKSEYFSFIISTALEGTAIQVDWGDTKLIDYTIGTSKQEITGTVNGNNIYIYGEGIAYLNVNSRNLTALSISVSASFTELYCASNLLKKLDVSNLKDLTILNCSYNQISELNVKNSRSLKALFITSNLLDTIDVSKNPLLTQLYCSSNKLRSLHLSENSLLTTLACASNKLTSLDVSNNTALTYLSCFTNSIEKIDVFKNTELNYFSCFSNLLTSIDVSQNSLLNYFNCSANLLTNLDVSQNKALTSLSCNSNKLTFPTLPVKASTWTTYSYSPQQTIEMPKFVYDIGENIDLSYHLTPSITLTQFIWKTESGVILNAGTDYDENNGIFKFLVVPSEDVYCQMSNASFPDLILKTQKISISAVTQVSKVVSFFSIYPNPVKDILYIKSPEIIKKIELLTATGKLVSPEKIDKQDSFVSVNMTNLPQGIYLIKIYGESKVSLNKLIKE